MTTEHWKICDGCGKRVSSDSDEIWYALQPVATTMKAVTDFNLSAESRGVEPSSLIDSGDFCSLMCVANFASARQSLRDLDREDPIL